MTDGVAELHFERTVTSGSRLAGVSAGLAIMLAGSAINATLLALFGTLVLLGALTARSSRTFVDRGTVLQDFAAAPLRPAAIRTIEGDRIRGIEVVHEHDTDALPARADQYWVVLRLTDRRRPVSLGDRHDSREPAEAQATALRTALGRPQPGEPIELHLPAAPHERLTLLAGSVGAVLATWAALDTAGGRPMEDVWPLAALSLVGALTAVALLGAAALTAGTTGEVRPATAIVLMQRGVGRLGRRSVCIRFEEIDSVDIEGENLDGGVAVVLTLRSGGRVPIYRGANGSSVAKHLRQLIAAERR